MYNPLTQRLRALCVAALAMASVAQAQPSPWVYRLDTRPPTVIFAQGIHTEGLSGSLFDHLFAGACNAPALQDRSTWLTLSTDRQLTLDALASVLRRGVPLANYRGSNGIWLYAIHPDNSYLTILGIMRQAIQAGDNRQQGFTGVHANILRNLIYNRYFENQRDVVTQHVYPSNIYSGGFLTLNNARQVALLEASVVDNAHYQAPATQMTDHIDNLAMLLPPERIARYEDLPSEIYSCSTECDANLRAERKRRSPEQQAPYCGPKPTRSQAFVGSEE